MTTDTTLRSTRALGPGRQDLRPAPRPRAVHRTRTGGMVRAPRPRPARRAPSGCSTSEPAPGSSRCSSPRWATPSPASTTRPACSTRRRTRRATPASTFASCSGRAVLTEADGVGELAALQRRDVRRGRQPARALDDAAARRSRSARGASVTAPGGAVIAIDGTWWGGLDARTRRRGRRPRACAASPAVRASTAPASTRATAAETFPLMGGAFAATRAQRVPACRAARRAQRVPRRHRRGRAPRDVVRRPPREPVAPLPRRGHG